jgi:hypothetical protein
MHPEHVIPVKILAPGSKSNPTSVRVLSNFDVGGLLTLSLRLFTIDYGGGGDIYVKPAPRAGAYGELRSKGPRPTFSYDQERPLKTATADAHPYVSFHRSGKINNPARATGEGFDHALPFDLMNPPGYSHLCSNILGSPGIYEPGAPQGPGDVLFNCFPDLNARVVPIITMDIAPFAGDPQPILEAAGRDPDVSYGYLLIDPDSGAPTRFLRVRLHFGRLEDGTPMFEEHHVVHPTVAKPW